MSSPDARQLRLVPTKYHRSSGLAGLDLLVHEAWHRPYRYLRHPKGGAVEIPPAAFCEVEFDHGRHGVLVDVVGFPVLAEAVLLMGKLYFCGIKTERYMTLFKAYECLASMPAIEFAAVRHGLSHAPSRLARPKTVETLKRLFGTTTIDLSRSCHARTYYRQLVLLLSETDRLLADTLWARRRALRVVKSSKEVLTDWQVDGIPGFTEPIRVRQVRLPGPRQPSNRPRQPAGGRLPFE